MLLNIKFSYLYRDAGNYKNFGEAVFGNSEHLSVEDIRISIEANLIEGQWFIAKDLELSNLFFEEFGYDEELDHNWHEFGDVEETNEEANTDEDIQVFLRRLAGRKYGSIFD
jgi:hypothetical protein